MGGPAGYPHVAGHGQLEPAAQGESVHRGHDRQPGTLHLQGQALAIGDLLQGCLGPVAHELLDVRPGDEEPVAGPGHHRGRQASVGLELLKSRPQTGKHRPVEGIGRGMVHDQPADRPPPLSPHHLGHSYLPMRAGTILQPAG
jgi:hypothetical protein